MEHVYHLNGTPLDLQEILQSQFSMDEEAAKFSVCLLLSEQQQTLNEISDFDTELWYMRKQERYTTPVLNSRFSISLTDVKRNLLDQLAIQFAGILIDGDSLAFSAIVGCLLAVYRSGTYIKDEECCVYYQALEWKKTHVSQEYFRIQDIFPHCIEAVCCHLDRIRDGKWKCDFCHEEKCGADIDPYRRILEGLCQRNVLIEYNGMYRFAK